MSFLEEDWDRDREEREMEREMRNNQWEYEVQEGAGCEYCGERYCGGDCNWGPGAAEHLGVFDHDRDRYPAPTRVEIYPGPNGLVHEVVEDLLPHEDPLWCYECNRHTDLCVCE